MRKARPCHDPIMHRPEPNVICCAYDTKMLKVDCRAYFEPENVTHRSPLADSDGASLMSVAPG